MIHDRMSARIADGSHQMRGVSSISSAEDELGTMQLQVDPKRCLDAMQRSVPHKKHDDEKMGNLGLIAYAMVKVSSGFTS